MVFLFVFSIILLRQLDKHKPMTGRRLGDQIPRPAPICWNEIFHGCYPFATTENTRQSTFIVHRQAI
jgi:hypothetical protein